MNSKFWTGIVIGGVLIYLFLRKKSNGSALVNVTGVGDAGGGSSMPVSTTGGICTTGARY